MTRPEIIRADSIDLQDREAPSAIDHSRSKPSAPLAPHQAQTLREAAAEAAEENLHSPRVSWGTGPDVENLQQYVTALTASNTSSPEGKTPTSTLPGTANMQQQDALAIAQNGGHEVSEEDLDADADEDGMDDDLMDKISSSPSIEDEDIDFEFVYALHTFVATVEGQANATKGDTMVLLDDSNSYWWLVRVVKDSSIGYLPAEHIETPTERLARLNKHRNIDLSATMLGDQAEKTKNPLKSAMRRRKTKTVTFAAPTYVDYSDIDYSTEEEEREIDDYLEQQQQQQQQQQRQEQRQEQQSQQGQNQQQQQQQQHQKPQEQQKQSIHDQTGHDDPAGLEGSIERSLTEAKPADTAPGDASGDIPISKGSNRSSEEIFEASKSETPGPTKTKDGTVRDSFFKDDTVETKKITLTPNLLRDDGAPRASTESKEVKQRPSLDKVDKESILSREEKRKRDKKERERKPSVIRNFFTRGGKKKPTDEDDESFGKRSMDSSTDNHNRDADETDEGQGSEKAATPQRQPSKLQKQPRTEPSPTRKPGPAAREAAAEASTVNNVANVPPATMRIVEESAQDIRDPAARAQSMGEPGDQRDGRAAVSKTFPSRTEVGESPAQRGTIHKMVPAQVEGLESGDESAPALENSGRRGITAGDRRQESRTPRQQRSQQQQRSTSLTAQADGGGVASWVDSSSTTDARTPAGSLSGSSVQPTTEASGNLPGLVGDTSSQEDQSSPLSSPSPEPLDGDDGSPARHRKEDSVTTSTSTTSSAWNDTSLRAFFDSASDIRDLLVVVYDKSEVAPPGLDHPIAGTLFREQNAKLAEITTQLDNMLGDWLARKQRLRGAV